LRSFQASFLITTKISTTEKYKSIKNTNIWRLNEMLLNNQQITEEMKMLIFCLDDLSISVSGVLKSPTIIVLLLSSPLIVVSICLMYWGVPMLGAYICLQFLCSFLGLIPWSLCTSLSKCPLSLITVFILKSILSDMSIATSALFWSPFAWNIFPSPWLWVFMCP